MKTNKAISKILQGFQPACVVTTANELKVFDELKQPVNAKHVAENCNLAPEATERLLNALTSLEIITKENDKYHLPQVAQDYLVTGGSLFHAVVDTTFCRSLSCLGSIGNIYQVWDPHKKYYETIGRRSA